MKYPLHSVICDQPCPGRRLLSITLPTATLVLHTLRLKIHWFNFYRATAMLSAVYAVVVCLSVCVCVFALRYCITSSSAMAEGPRDALVSRNSATTKYPYRMALFA